MRSMMIAAVTAGMLACGGKADAQETVRLAMSGAARPAADSAKAATRLVWARELMVRGDFNGARRELGRAVRDARASGSYAGPALWEMANIEHLNAPLRAAEILDQAAIEAETYGDPVAQARALLAAAVLYQQADRPGEARARVDRLRPMLRSPYLPEELRKELLRSVPPR